MSLSLLCLLEVRARSVDKKEKTLILSMGVVVGMIAHAAQPSKNGGAWQDCFSLQAGWSMPINTQNTDASRLPGAYRRRSPC
jgi:hypothetical protein